MTGIYLFGVVLGFAIGLVVMHFALQPTIRRLTEKIKKLQNRSIFYGILERIFLICTFKVRTIDASTKEEGLVSWSPYLSIIPQDVGEGIYEIIMLQETMGGYPETACKLFIDLSSKRCSVTLEAQGHKEKYSFNPTKIPDRFLQDVRSFIKPPSGLIIDKEADQLLQNLRSEKKIQN